MKTKTNEPAGRATEEPPDGRDEAEGAQPNENNKSVSSKDSAADQEKKPKKGSKKPLVILAIVLLLAAIGGTIYYLHARNYESTDDAFVDGNVVQVSPKVAATVVAVHFTDNAKVTKGELLIELDPRNFQVAIEKAKAQLAQAEAQTTQQSAQTEVAGVNFGRTSGLYNKDARAVSKEQVDTAKATLDGAKGALEAVHATVQAAKASVHDAELQLSYTKIFSVSDGRIARKQVEAGNYIQPGQTLCSLVKPEVWVTANFKETQLTRMLRRQPVRIKVDAFPDRELKGHVESFQPGTGARFSLLPAENATGNYVKVVQRVPVKILFDESEQDLQRLAPGQSVLPTVDITVKPNQEPPRPDSR